MDSAGRLVIPREVRRQAGWAPGVPLEVRWRDDHVEIEPAPAPVRLERRGHLLVAVPAGDGDEDGAGESPGPPLTTAQVERIREELHTRADLV
jgi:AbrB family looped-hinge helix DNA binding protein